MINVDAQTDKFKNIKQFLRIHSTIGGRSNAFASHSHIIKHEMTWATGKAGNGNGNGKRERETKTGRGSRRLKGTHVVRIRL